MNHQSLPSNARLVEISAAAWLFVAILGQLAFFLFIATFYAVPALVGEIAQWNSNQLLITPPYDPDNLANTWSFGTHAIGASYIALTGGIQILPSVRQRYPKFHRWNGRIFLTLVFMLTLSGFYLVWVRGPIPNELNELSTTVNGILILVCGFAAVRFAIRRDLKRHQAWALRLFLVANAQWFLRIGGFGYFFVVQSLGFEVGFDSAFFKFWMWGCYLVPLAMCELYLFSRHSASAGIHRLTAGGFVLSTLATLIGSFVFSAFTLQMTQGNV